MPIHYADSEPLDVVVSRYSILMRLRLRFAAAHSNMTLRSIVSRSRDAGS